MVTTFLVKPTTYNLSKSQTINVLMNNTNVLMNTTNNLRNNINNLRNTINNLRKAKTT
jgi:uncharacterized protein YoxC